MLLCSRWKQELLHVYLLQFFNGIMTVWTEANCFSHLKLTACRRIIENVLVPKFLFKFWTKSRIFGKLRAQLNFCCIRNEIEFFYLLWRGFKDFGVTSLTFLGSRDVISHVTIRLGICGFLLVVYWNHASILHHYRDIKPQSCICPC